MNTTDLIPIEPNAGVQFHENQAEELLAAFESGDLESVTRIRKYEANEEELIDGIAAAYTIGDARLVIAMDHGFHDWSRFVEHLKALSDKDSNISKFETAVEAIINGDVETLKALINASPELVNGRSSRVHRATLLHYIAANGVENFRQKSPANAVEIAEILLKSGSEPDAFADIYDGKWATTLGLLVSSIHPSKAGVQGKLVDKLLDYGAAINGVNNDCSPLITALSFHYPEAAEALAAKGANLSNIVAVAGLGKTDLLENFFEDGHIKNDLPLLDIEWLKTPKTAQANLELAFVWAAMHNRTVAVEFLLKEGVKPEVKDFRGWTALHWAAFYGYVKTCQLLLDWRAPLEVQNEFGGTVLDQTLWVTANQSFDDEHVEIIEILCEAGAEIHNWWLVNNFNPPLDQRITAILEKYKS